MRAHQGSSQTYIGDKFFFQHEKKTWIIEHLLYLSIQNKVNRSLRAQKKSIIDRDQEDTVPGEKNKGYYFIGLPSTQDQ